MHWGKTVPTEDVGGTPQQEGLDAEQAKAGDIHHGINASNILGPGTKEQLCCCFHITFHKTAVPD